MDKKIINLLKSYSTDTISVDRILISAFVRINNIKVEKNLLVSSTLIRDNDTEEIAFLDEFIKKIKINSSSFTFESLIELFEHVVSPQDRIISGAVYTPKHIRSFLINKAFQKKTNVGFSNLKVADIACGCGGFLLDAAIYLKKKTKKSYKYIFAKQIYGLDIQAYSTKRTKLILSLLALSEGEDYDSFSFNIFDGDALTFDWTNILNNNLFDIVLGNPPYVCCRNLDEKTKQAIKKWEVASIGNPDLYIPFFQIAMELMKEDGILGFITMNTFFKSLNARALRGYFSKRESSLDILDFGSEQVFKNKNTYTCLCLISNKKRSFVRYKLITQNDLKQKISHMDKIPYKNLNAVLGWNLKSNEFATIMETNGISFGEKFKTRHGIATLKNDVYIFKPTREDEIYYYLKSDKEYPIEKSICRDIINANKLSRPVKINDLLEKVIFPYNNEIRPKIIEERVLKKKFPKAYKYLQSKKDILAKRDKGNGKYEAWYAFGRTQSLEKFKIKLLFPKFSDKPPHCILSEDANLLFYNGQAVICESKEDAFKAKRILESNEFWNYIVATSKPYSANYFSLNGNYINNFSIHPE